MLIKFQPLGPNCGRQPIQRTRRGSASAGAHLRAGRAGRAEDADGQRAPGGRAPYKLTTAARKGRARRPGHGAGRGRAGPDSLSPLGARREGAPCRTPRAQTLRGRMRAPPAVRRDHHPPSAPALAGPWRSGAQRVERRTRGPLLAWAWEKTGARKRSCRARGS